MAAEPNAGPPVAPGAGAKAPAVRHHTTQTHRAYDAPHTDVSRPWQFLVVALLAVAVTESRPARCAYRRWPARTSARLARSASATSGAAASGTICEPWIRRAVRR